MLFFIPTFFCHLSPDSVSCHVFPCNFPIAHSFGRLSFSSPPPLFLSLFRSSLLFIRRCTYLPPLGAFTNFSTVVTKYSSQNVSPSSGILGYVASLWFSNDTRDFFPTFFFSAEEFFLLWASPLLDTVRRRPLVNFYELFLPPPQLALLFSLFQTFFFPLRRSRPLWFRFLSLLDGDPFPISDASFRSPLRSFFRFSLTVPLPMSLSRDLHLSCDVARLWP